MNNSKLQRLRSLSLFADEQITRLNQDFIDFYQTQILDRALQIDELTKQLTKQINNCENDVQLAKKLRVFRNLHQVRLIYRMINGLSNYHETAFEISSLACCILNVSYDFLYKRLAKQYGAPQNADNSPMHMVIIGMGKLGAMELNLSSDIDLIFSYPAGGKTCGSGSIDHHDFFTKLGQKLIKLLNQTTEDGFVFRVDMRLRPFGSNSSLALPFDALIHYYQTQGRDWERYALIKAYPVAGNIKDGLKLMDALRPFVYRHYLDFSAISAMRGMKQLIVQEVNLNNRKNNIKLGSGGIREVEFIAQVLQLIYGGKNKNLQHRSLLKTLHTLEEANFISAEIKDELTDAYIFLRNTEHALQSINDQQVQDLPNDAQTQNKIARILGFNNWQDFYQKLKQHQAIVAYHFANLIADDIEQNEQSAVWQDLWCNIINQAQINQAQINQTDNLNNNLDVNICQQLQKQGFKDGKKIADNLITLADTAQKRASASSIERLNLLMPKLLHLIGTKLNADDVFSRILPLIYAVLRRSSYFALLNENSYVLKQVVNLYAKSSLLAEQITRYPVLLDELLDATILKSAPSTAELCTQLKFILHLNRHDFEQQMEKLRTFKLAHTLKACDAFLAKHLTFMQVSDYLTFLAEAILHHTFNLAWTQISAKYGNPPNASLQNPNFIITGYGKLGGLELSLGSDLDLVFLYDNNPNLPTINSNKSIDTAEFYARLTQKIIHILTTQTVSGNLYEIDLRLRPSGKSGLLVSNINAFEDYQKSRAQTWEHQALLRARSLVGNDDLKAKFEHMRQNIISQRRNLDDLQIDISNMRHKMRQNAPSAPNMFNLKHGQGGMIDLEFIVQFLALAYAHKYPQISKWSDNIRILDELGICGVLSKNDVQNLQQTYLKYRSAAHELYLQNLKHAIDNKEFTSERQQITNLWHKLNLD